KALDIDPMNTEVLNALQKTNRAERGQMFYERRLHMQGTGVGTFAGIIFLLVNELLLNPQVIQGIIMQGIIFSACAYLGYAATKFYTDILKQQRDLLLEAPKEVQTALIYVDILSIISKFQIHLLVCPFLHKKEIQLSPRRKGDEVEETSEGGGMLWTETSHPSHRRRLSIMKWIPPVRQN
ncbi:hypothetical protein BSL78_22065, partial [Apostichopus japonicus]